MSVIPKAKMRSELEKCVLESVAKRGIADEFFLKLSMWPEQAAHLGLKQGDKVGDRITVVESKKPDKGMMLITPYRPTTFKAEWKDHSWITWTTNDASVSIGERVEVRGDE